MTMNMMKIVNTGCIHAVEATKGMNIKLEEVVNMREERGDIDAGSQI